MTKMFRTVVPVLLLVATTTVAEVSATTALDNEYGTPREGASARSLAMGQVGVSGFQGSASVVQNPAVLALHRGRGLIDLQVGIREASENRFVPLYDTFGDLVAETAYALNRNTYTSGQGGLIWRLPGDNLGSVAIGIFERYDTDFDYEEEIRNPEQVDPPDVDRIEQVNRLEFDGRLRSWSIGYGHEIMPSVHLGLAAHRYFGDLERQRSEVPVDGAPTLQRLSRELSGWGFGVGAHVRGYERFDVGVSVEAPFTLDGNHSLTVSDGTGFEPATDAPAPGDYELEYPMSVAFGLSFHPRNDLRTVFSAEVHRRYWEDLEDGFADSQAELEGAEDGAQLAFRNTWDFRTGVEHIFYNGMPARFGFRFVENHADRDSERVILSLGSGYAFQGLRVDLTGVYTRQTYRQDYLFDAEAAGGDPPPRDVPDLAPKVEDSIVRFVLGVSREF